MKNTFTIGADPELFLKNSSGKFISSIGLIGGTKEAPLPISKDGHAIQEDNVSVEFNIPPSNSAQEFVSHLNFVLKHLEEKAKGMSLQFATGVAAASFDEDQLMNPAALVFGCEPDFNAWTGRKNPRPHADDWKLRSCGGHVHVGTKLDKRKVIKAMDLFLGVPSVVLDTGENSVKRRQLYGNAGAFRPKSYGAEYRTLSNFWIWEDKLKEWVYTQTQKALEFVEDGFELNEEHGDLIQGAINNGDMQSVEILNREFALL